MRSTFLPHIILIKIMGKRGSFKEDEKENFYTHIKTQDPRCIKGNRVSKLFLTIDERCEVTKLYSLYQRNQGTILKFNFSYFYEICHFKAN